MITQPHTLTLISTIRLALEAEDRAKRAGNRERAQELGDILNGWAHHEPTLYDIALDQHQEARNAVA